MGVEEIEQQFDFSGWGWLRLGKGQQYFFKYDVIMDLLKFKSRSPLYLKVNHKKLLYSLLLLNWRVGGDCKAIARERGLGRRFQQNFVTFDLLKHISSIMLCCYNSRSFLVIH